MDEKYIKRAVNAFKQMREALVDMGDVDDTVVALLIISARIEAVEDTLISALPTAGEGI